MTRWFYVFTVAVTAFICSGCLDSAVTNLGGLGEDMSPGLCYILAYTGVVAGAIASFIVMSMASLAFNRTFQNEIY